MWIASYQELARNPKLGRLARALQVNKPTAIGLLHGFWWWVAEHRPSGNLHKVDPWRIGDAAGWAGDDLVFLYALEVTGFIDRTTEGMVVHDWADWSGPKVRQQRKDREKWHAEYMAARQQAIERDGYTCQLCGYEVNPGDMHVDHIVPRSKGGSDTADNLRVTHSYCNLYRGDKDLRPWQIEYLQRRSQQIAGARS
jgi:hypothetical protein